MKTRRLSPGVVRHAGIGRAPDRFILRVALSCLTALMFLAAVQGQDVGPGIPGTYTITATAGPHGMVVPQGNIVVAEGSAFVFVINPDVGHRIADVAVDGESVGRVPIYEFKDVRADHTLQAVFAPYIYTLDIISRWDSPVPEPGTHFLAYGTVVNCIVTESPVVEGDVAYVCTGWSGSGSAPLTGTGLETGPFVFTGPSRVKWLWETTYRLTLAAGEGGTVSGEAGWLTAGAETTVAATAGAGYRFLHWTGDVPAGQETANPLTLTMDQPRSLAAEFEALTFSIVASAGPEGTIQPAGTLTVAYGASASYVVAAGDGFRIADVLVDGASVGAVGTYTFTDVQADHTIHAAFRRDRVPMNDFDGDGRTDFAVYDEDAGRWYLLQSTEGFAVVKFGKKGMVPVPADYDGDGRTDAALFEPGPGLWYIKESSGKLRVEQFGWWAPVPVPADYDGDGKADLAMYSAREATWYLLQSTAGFAKVELGCRFGVPVPGDYDGDGLSDMAVYSRNGVWYLLLSSAGLDVRGSGWFGLTPVPEDYDGDGLTDPAVYSGRGEWQFWLSNDTVAEAQLGGCGAVPVPGDYDGDGAADVAVYQRKTGVWYVELSGSGEPLEQQFGSKNMVPCWPEPVRPLLSFHAARAAWHARGCKPDKPWQKWKKK
ncbi:MAG: VCBS repeat-containing protein [Kiritimatiellae bacterium]|nr:VCBS repeat-containing protein [Kiritimatiellia bacterium]